MLALSWATPEAPWKAREPNVSPGLKPVTVSPAMVVEPVKVAGPETVKVENVEVAAEKVPATLALPEKVALPNEELPCTVKLPVRFSVLAVKFCPDRLVKPARLPPV